MKNLKLEEKWLNDMIPEGLPYPSSTLISGPGGTGKPLMGFAFIYNWLRNGGKVIFVALQYPDTRFVRETLEKLYNLNMDHYQERVVYVQADFESEEMKVLDGNIINVNLAKPEVWQEVIDRAEGIMVSFDKQETLGTMVFAAALNLLLFSPTYKDVHLKNLESFLKANDERSYLFTVSTTMFKEEIERLEKAADNLMFAEMGEEMQMYLEIERMANQDIVLNEREVPFAKELLTEIKEIADYSRKKVIPTLKKI